MLHQNEDLVHPETMAASEFADMLIASELGRQLMMWGDPKGKYANGELMKAGIAQLDALFDRREGLLEAFDEAPEIYPENWDPGAFRDYGSDAANIVVSISFLYKELVRLIANGEDTTRLPRDHFHQAYTTATPQIILDEGFAQKQTTG